ncbi:MAG: DUF1016 domain-containing protein [bacterium]|nr:DUF1016 domain-containing protein [bacterium]
MIQFAEVYPDEQIVVSLIRQLSWTHFRALIPLSARARSFLPCLLWCGSRNRTRIVPVRLSQQEASRSQVKPMGVRE